MIDTAKESLTYRKIPGKPLIIMVHYYNVIYWNSLRTTAPLCGDSTDDWRIPLTKGQQSGVLMFFLDVNPNKLLNKGHQSWRQFGAL